MVRLVQMLGNQGIGMLQRLGASGIFLSRIVLRRPRVARSVPMVVEQIYELGVLSVLIIVISALFIGMVVGLQGYNTLEKFGVSSQLGQLLALSIVRELGPVISALLFVGRAGSALTAEIGLMKTTDQLASMEMMGVDPLWRVIYPRFWAGIIVVPMLAIIFSAVAIYGGYFIGVSWLGVDAGSFWSNMQAGIDYRADIMGGIVKSVFFGVVVTWIAVYQGMTTKPTAAGISRATTKTVVYASLAILGFDFILTSMMIGAW